MNITLLLFSLGGAVLGGLAHAKATAKDGSQPLQPTMLGSFLGAVVGFVVGVMSLGSGTPGSSPTAGGDGKFVEITSEAEFEKSVLNASGTVLVDFYATWCGPCKMMVPQLEKLQAQNLEDFSIVKIDVDKAKTLAQKYQIRSIPTLYLFKDGKKVKELVGFKRADALLNDIKPVL